MKKILSVCLAGLALLTSSCNDEDEQTYVFTGDSIIARWDLQNSFPILITRNDGKSGSGLAYLQDRAGMSAGQIAVVLSGTNDYRTITSDEDAREYAAGYILALRGLGAKRVYAISVLPRAFKNDDATTLPTIMKLNRAISDEINRTAEGSVIFVDVYDQFLDGDEGFNMNLTYDGLHLNPEGYAILTSALNHHLL